MRPKRLRSSIQDIEILFFVQPKPRFFSARFSVARLDFGEYLPLSLATRPDLEASPNEVLSNSLHAESVGLLFNLLILRKPFRLFLRPIPNYFNYKTEPQEKPIYIFQIPFCLRV